MNWLSSRQPTSIHFRLCLNQSHSAFPFPFPHLPNFNCPPSEVIPRRPLQSSPIQAKCSHGALSYILLPLHHTVSQPSAISLLLASPCSSPSLRHFTVTCLKTVVTNVHIIINYKLNGAPRIVQCRTEQQPWALQF